MWFKMKSKVNSRNNSNKQSAKGGAIKNSTIEINGGGVDNTLSVVLTEVLKIKEKIDSLENKSNKIHKAFNLYVQHNGVPYAVKEEVKLILEL